MKIDELGGLPAGVVEKLSGDGRVGCGVVLPLFMLWNRPPAGGAAVFEEEMLVCAEDVGVVAPPKRDVGVLDCGCPNTLVDGAAEEFVPVPVWVVEEPKRLPEFVAADADGALF